jgi:hypothetical protein
VCQNRCGLPAHGSDQRAGVTGTLVRPWIEGRHHGSCSNPTIASAHVPLKSAAAEFDVRALAFEELLEKQRHGAEALRRGLNLDELSLSQAPPAVFAELSHEPTNLGQREPGILSEPDHHKLRQGPVIEDTAAGESRRPRDQAFLFVEPNGRRGDPGAA